MSNASLKMNGVEVFSENAQTVTVKNINVDANDTTTPSMCKAWVSFDGTLAMTVNSSYGPDAPPADFSSPNPIRAAYNVDYIIDRGTGQYEIHFENAMPDVNYAATFGCDFYQASNYSTVVNTVFNGLYSTTSLRVEVTYAFTTALQDSPRINVAIFR